MAEFSNDTIRGLTVTDHGDGSYTITRSGTESSPAFARWLALLVLTYPEVGVLVHDLVTGRRGKNAEYRPVTVESVRFRPETLVADAVAIGPHDQTGYPIDPNPDVS